MAMRDKDMLRILIDLLHLEDGVLRFVGALSSKHKLLIRFYDGVAFLTIFFSTLLFYPGRQF